MIALRRQEIVNAHTCPVEEEVAGHTLSLMCCSDKSDSVDSPHTGSLDGVLALLPPVSERIEDRQRETGGNEER